MQYGPRRDLALRATGPDVSIPRLWYRLNAIPSGAQLLAQRPHDRIDNVAADMGSSPDALDKILPSHHRRRTIDQLAENLPLQRRELDCASFHPDLAPVACEIQLFVMGYSVRACINQGRNPLDDVAPGDFEYHCIRHAGLRLFHGTKAEPVHQVAVFRKCVGVDPRHSPALDVVAL